MCGRYTLAADEDELIEAFEVPRPSFEVAPRYNIAPGQAAPVVAEDRRGRRMGLMRWGFVPAWRSDVPRPLINARAESVATRPSFRDAFRRRRCVVPADGFYEWARAAGGTRPYWFHAPDGRVLAMAGVWEGEGFAVVTTEAGADVRPFHPRMPAFIERPDLERWLAKDTKPDEALALLRPPPPGSLVARPVSTRVNSPAVDEPSLIEPVGSGA